MTVGDRIAQARLNLGARRGKAMTQTELGRLVGVMPATVSQWESGTVTPALATIPKIAESLGVSAGYLAFGEEAADPQAQDYASARPITPAEIERARAARDADQAAKSGRRKTPRRKANGGPA